MVPKGLIKSKGENAGNGSLLGSGVYYGEKARSFFSTRLNGKMNGRCMAEMIGANTHWCPLCILIFPEGFQKSFTTH